MKLEVIQYKNEQAFYKEAFRLQAVGHSVFASNLFKDGVFIIFKEHFNKDTYYLLYNGKLGIRNARSVANRIYASLPSGQGVFTCEMFYKALKTLLDNMWRENVRSCNYFNIKVERGN